MKNRNSKFKYKKHSKKTNNIIDDINKSGFIFNDSKEDEQKNPEWMNPETINIQDTNKRFEQEILDYVEYITPKNNSLAKREKTFELFTKIVNKYRPDWKIFLFGSFKQNIATVFSDLDFLILYENKNSSEYDLKEMYNLMNFLKKEEFSNNIRLAKAKVPVLRATCSATGINVDISVNRENGNQAVEALQTVLTKYSILRPSIIILKLLLKKFNLNDPHSGGMNSFLLFHLVYFFYIHKINEKNKEDNSDLNLDNKEKNKYFSFNVSNNPKINLSLDDQISSNNSLNMVHDNSSENNFENEEIDFENIGNFIYLFLKFYGYEFDYKRFGLCLNKNNFGNYYIKDERKDMECSKTISAESIIEKGKDVGLNCYNYPIIIKLFKEAYNIIKYEKEKNVCSILNSLGFPSIDLNKI